MLLVLYVCPLFAQDHDSIKLIRLRSVDVTAESFTEAVERGSTLPVDVAGRDYIRRHFAGGLMQTLQQIPGVRSMDIGTGFSKPMIRGMAFNRVIVAENGIKQEGQQWGGDHGLEMDAFDMERVVVIKGPASLLYGSDAMGGVIDIDRDLMPAEDQVYGEVLGLGKSVNDNIGGSVMLGLKKGRWHVKSRYTEQNFGDFRVPADEVVYLTRKIPVYGKRLKNTAGRERDASVFAEYRRGCYYANVAVSNIFQKMGFFPGAHGVPNLSLVESDGNARNIELPYSTVNHFKVTTRQKYCWDSAIATWDIGWQNNHRQELSRFHTHYQAQPAPVVDPDKELEFMLRTASSSLRLTKYTPSDWEYAAGWDVQYQDNDIDGYGFLLPAFERFTTGLSGVGTWSPSSDFSLSGGVRYDYGKVDIAAYEDVYLTEYLTDKGSDRSIIDQYRWRSYRVDRSFGDFSCTVGMVWSFAEGHRLKANIGRGFRLPGANELASNGVHHGAFRHEQGDPGLSSERGWQLDVAYSFETEKVCLSVSPFVSWYSNYIYLQPTGEWSVLPHAGQIYRYTGAEVLFAGLETSFQLEILPQLEYNFGGEYVYNRNLDERTALSFSPPATMRNSLTWKNEVLSIRAELETIATQKHVARNESQTPGANIVHLGATADIRFGRSMMTASLSLRNVFNTRYYNHLSFYRMIEIPEPGRNIQLLITIPFKSKLQ